MLKQIEPQTYQLQAIDETMLEEITQLYNNVFGKNVSPAFIDWKYFQTPDGDIYGTVAVRDGEIVSTHGLATRRIKVLDEEVAAVEAVDAITDKSARRQGLFVKLSHAAYERMDEDEIVLGFCFPNPLAGNGFLNRLGWVTPGDIPRYIKILDSRAMVAKSDNLRDWLKGAARQSVLWMLRQSGRQSSWKGTVRPIERFDARFDKLWQTVSADFRIANVRTAAYLNYRYIENPRRGGYVCFAAEKGGELIGYAVLSLHDAPTRAYLLELLVRPNCEAAGDALLQAVTEAARLSQSAQIQAWQLSHFPEQVALLEANGFLHGEANWLPGDLRFGQLFLVRQHPDLDAPHNLDVTDLRNWYISMGDHDYY